MPASGVKVIQIWILYSIRQQWQRHAQHVKSVKVFIALFLLLIVSIIPTPVSEITNNFYWTHFAFDNHFGNPIAYYVIDKKFRGDVNDLLRQAIRCNGWKAESRTRTCQQFFLSSVAGVTCYQYRVTLTCPHVSFTFYSSSNYDNHGNVTVIYLVLNSVLHVQDFWIIRIRLIDCIM